MELIHHKAYRTSLEHIWLNTDLQFLQGKTVMVTGASGMLGSCLVDALELWNEEQRAPCRVIAVSRDWAAAKVRFSTFWNKNTFIYFNWNVLEPLQRDFGDTDYIIHAASNADPVRIAEYPADTLAANVLGTKNLMDYGLRCGMKRFLFVSSGEVYGQPDSNWSDFTEDYCGALDLSDSRSCYPEGKRAAEILCQCYINQWGADAVVVRPCHLFGPTMAERDSRAVSEFLRQAAAREDIVMKSAGMLERSHCYVVDAAKALLLVLRDGVCGQAYNIADRQYQMPIRAFAERAAAAGNCQVTYARPTDKESNGYSRIRRAVLDPGRIESLGWMPEAQNSCRIQETVNILHAVGSHRKG